MSTTVDSRVVDLQFNNAQFEQNIRESLASIELLNTKLDGIGGNNLKGLTDNGNEARNTLDGVADSVTGIENRFTTLGIIGMTVIQNLTNSAMNLISKATGQAVSGGISRALNIERARFQMEGLGMDVAKIMGEGGPVQNAVKGTAYGLDEAAKAASMLGASMSDVDVNSKEGLKTLESHLTTISGVAAMTGRSYTDIADIFSTVASNGRLMTQQVRQFAFSGLNVSSILAKEFNKTEEQINSMVTKGEISFDKFSEAMSQFGEHAKEANKTFEGATSNIKAALGRIGGDFYGGADGVSGFFENLRYIIAGDKEDLENGKGLIALIDGVRHVLQPLTYSFNEFGNNISKKVYTNISNLADELEGFASGFGTKGSRANDLLNGFTKALGLLKERIDGIKPNLKAFKADFISIFDSTKKILTDLAPSFVKLGIVFTNVINKIISGSEMLLHAFAEMLHEFAYSGTFSSVSDVLNGLLAAMSSGIGNAANMLSYIVSSLSVGLQKASGYFAKVADGIAVAIKKIVAAASGTNMNNPNYFLGIINIAGIIAMVKMMKSFNVITAGLGAFPKIFAKKQIFARGGIATRFTIVLGDLRDTLFGFQRDLKAKIIRSIAVSIGILAASLFLLSSIDTLKLSKALVGMEILLLTLMRSIRSFATMFGAGAGALSKTMLSDVAVLTSLSVALVAIGTAILSLAVAVKILGSMDIKDLAKGLGSVLILLGSLLGVISVFGHLKMSLAQAQGFVIIAAGMVVLGIALNVLARAVKNLSKIPIAQLGKGILATVILIQSLMFSMRLLSLLPIETNAASLMAISAIIMSIAIAVDILASAVSKLGKLSIKEITKGLGGMFLILASIVKVITALNSSKLSIFGGSAALGLSAGIVLIAVAIRVLVESLKEMGKLPIKQLSFGLIGLLSIMGGLTAMLRLIPGVKIAPIAGGLLLISIAMNLFATAVAKFGNMDGSKLAKGLLSIAGVMVAIAGISVLLEAAIPAVLAMGIALSAFGAGLLLVSAGLTAFLTFLMLFVSQVSLLAMAFTSTMKNTIMIAGNLGKTIGTFVAGFISEFIKNIPNMIASIEAFLLKQIDNVVDFISFAISNILTAISKVIDKIVEKLLDIFGKIIDGLISKIGPIIAKLMSLAIVIIDSFAKALEENSERVSEAFSHLIESVGLLLQKILSKLPSLALTLLQMLAEGIIKGVNNVIPAITILIGKIALKMGLLPRSMLNAGINSMRMLRRGIVNTINSVVSAISSLVSKMTNKLSSLPGKFVSVGKNAIKGLAKGLSGSNISSIASNLGSRILNAIKKRLGIASPSKEMIKVGMFTIAGFVKGIKDNASKLAKASSQMGDEVTNRIGGAINDGYLDDLDFSFTITPVLDLSSIEAGMGVLDSMFSTDYAVGLSSNSSSMTPEEMVNSIIVGIKDAFDTTFNTDDEGSVTINLNSTLECEGQKIAESTAQYMSKEINKLIARSNRKNGNV